MAVVCVAKLLCCMYAQGWKRLLMDAEERGCLVEAKQVMVSFTSCTGRAKASLLYHGGSRNQGQSATLLLQPLRCLYDLISQVDLLAKALKQYQKDVCVQEDIRNASKDMFSDCLWKVGIWAKI